MVSELCFLSKVNTVQQRKEPLTIKGQGSHHPESKEIPFGKSVPALPQSPFRTMHGCPPPPRSGVSWSWMLCSTHFPTGTLANRAKGGTDHRDLVAQINGHACEQDTVTHRGMSHRVAGSGPGSPGLSSLDVLIIKEILCQHPTFVPTLSSFDMKVTTSQN